MPVNQDPKGDTPVPEAPVWLPSLSAPRGSPGHTATHGHSTTGYLLPKARNMPVAASIRSNDPASLYSVATLPTVESLGLEGLRRKQSNIPKLPSLEKSSPRTSRSHYASERIPTWSPKSSPTKAQRKTQAQRQLQQQLAQPGADESMLMGEEGASSGWEGQSGDDSGADSPMPGLEAATENMGPVATEDALYDPDIVPGIDTGEDVIEFYGKYGQDSAVKFFYCNRARGNVRFRPYDLVVVPRQKAEHEYFTMSATGVMRIKRGVQAEFTSLAEWVREKTLFDLISAISFFKNYLTGRAFRHWHKVVRQKNFNKVKQQIQDNLFLAKPTFSAHLRELWGYAYELQTVPFSTASANHLYQLQEWADLQNATREQKVRPHLEAISEKFQRVLERVCKEVQTQAKLYQESVRDQTELEDTTGVELVQGRSAGCARSMLAVKQEKLERAANFSRVMRELTMLGAFIRLADYLFVEGIIERAINSVHEMLQLLVSSKSNPDPKTNKGVFTTTISFLPHSLSFTPDEDSVLDELNSAVEGIVGVVQQAPRLLQMRIFAPYFDGKPATINGPAVIRATPWFQKLRQDINNTILEDFAAAHEYVQIFEDYRKVYDFGRTWSYEDYVAKQKTLREIRRDMHKQREWRNELDRMKISNVVGCLWVDSKSLRNELLPVTTSTLDKIKQLLLSMSRTTCIQVLEDLQQRIAMLQSRPTSLDEFMAYQVMHGEQVDSKKSVLQAASQVDDMYDMLGVYEQKVPTQDQVKHDDLREAASTLVTELANGKEFMADFKEHQIEALNGNIKAMKEELQAIIDSLGQGDYVNPDAEPEVVVADLEGLLAHLEELKTGVNTYKEYLSLLELEDDDFSVLQLTEKELTAKHQLWKSQLEFMDKSHMWTEDAILDDSGNMALSIETIRQTMEDYTQRAYKMAKVHRDDPVVTRFKESLEDFKQIMPLLEECGNPALKKRHWDEIFQVIEADIPPHEDGASYTPFSIRVLLQYAALDHLEAIQAISSTASKEYSLEKVLDKMQADWQGVEFRIIDYKDTGTFIMGGADDVQALLDDQIVKTQSMRASPFIKALEARTLKWEELLVGLQDLVDNWLQCQATWQYLEPIFSSPDILKQMPEEGEKFHTVDGAWREVMEGAAQNPGALTLAADKDKLAALTDNNRLLDEIQKGLAAYLELKRIAFPRFFFLSNDEMLEILSETKDPTRVQPHLKKCFEGIDKLRFEGAHNEITGMISVEGELISLKTRIKPADAHGAVEKWLMQVESGMVESVRDVVKQGIAAYAATPRSSWVLQWPGQVVLVVTSVYWTQEVAKAIGPPGEGVPGALQECADQNTAQLTDIVNLVRGELKKLDRATLSALVVMDVHARDVVQDLARQKIEGEPGHFSWLSQLRMYWEDVHNDPDNLSIMVRMMNAQVEYGYEYLGNSMRLVVTPLTDRCYRTLIGAIHLNLGGAPEGPAGTGKTETTKDLAKALARQCVVFNCSDTLDYLTMAKFFKGLASSGAWACFDEFNRIDLEVLSVVAQQVLEIQLAVKARVATFTFEGSELPLRPTCNVFITMNPGYAGRSELPDNLKALFRTVAMMVPDYAMIAEIMLYSNGYLEARDSARKIVATYKLCSEQLSSQDHYDYGMRAVMAVLRAAGNLKRRFPHDDEFELILRSIIDVNLCKFLSHDVPLFNGIVSDLFPGVVLPSPDYDALTAAMKKQCELMNLQATEYFIMKTIQLYEMIVVRHGLMTVGQPFSGKSCSLKVLAAALTDLHDQGVEGALFNRVQMRVLNPKAVTMGQLYGETDKATQEWKDGILAVTFRSLAAEISEDRKWLVLDGPVDAIWIENMNTVLDDNKKLCLPNSEIIQMSPTMSMIFEVGDLAVASPATVSRCGMVYLEPHQLGWKPLLASWLEVLPKALGLRARKHIEALFLWAMPACLRLVRKEVTEISPTEDIALANSTMRLMTSLMDEFQPVNDKEGAPPPPGATWDEPTKQQLVEGLFLFSLVWSVGATGDTEGRAVFDAFLRNLCLGSIPEGYAAYLPAKAPKLMVSPIPMDLGSTVYDYMFDKQKLSWVAWSNTLPTLSIPPNAQFSDIIIPTKDSARYTFLFDTALQHQQPLLMVGPTGTGKSVYIGTHLVSTLPRDKWTPVFVTFSARTTANMTQEQIDGRLDKRKKGAYGPPVGRRCVVFVDDLNMPAKEVYGAQPPIELLRQFMDMGGWYSRDNTFKQLVDVQFVAAMGPPGGGRTFVTNRYLRHFNTLALAQVSDDTLVQIFSSILDWHLASKGFAPLIKTVAPQIIAATLQVYRNAKQKLLPTPTKSHYVFNLRDFARVIQGVMMMPASALPVTADGASMLSMFRRLWVHEVCRVFYDRLVDDQDRAWLMNQMSLSASTNMNGVSLDELMSGLKAPGAAQLQPDDMRRCFFGDYMDPSIEPAERIYTEITDSSALLHVMEDYLKDLNATSKRPMNLAMFLFAVEHVSRICRLLKQPGGHMLLVGVGGSGRQSLTRLAAFICNMEVFQVEITKTYSRTEWREDLKRILRKAGGEAKPCVFLFSDTQIKDEAFVEDINNLLNSGEVPNMFPQDERMAVLEQVRPAASKKGLETPLELWGYFVQQCRNLLHVVLCMSPIGSAFRERLRQNPSLVNCCTIDWFQAWPLDALEAVALKFLCEVPALDEAARHELVKLCQAYHSHITHVSEEFLQDLGRHNYVTPTSYLELITAFKSLLETKRAQNTKLQSRYNVGLEKLASSAAQVTAMQAELRALQPQLVKTVKEVEILMSTIAHEKAMVVEPKAAIVKEEEAKAQEAANAAKAIKDECEADLAVAIPILNDALSALDTIKEADINYIKKLGNPPAAIKLVLEGVCVTLDVKPAKSKDETGKMITDFWKPSVALLNERDFLQRLKTYDKDNIPPRIITELRAKYISNENFTPDLAKKASPAAEGMCKWVHAMVSYDQVAKVVAPKKAKLAEAEALYQRVMEGLRAKQSELAGLREKLAMMENELRNNTRKKEKLEQETELCSLKLVRAEKLIGGLGGEKTRWTETAASLARAYVNLTGDMLISAGIIAYGGAFTASYRSRIIEAFVEMCRSANIPHTSRFSLGSILGEPIKIREWLAASLPNDSFSIENAIIVANARRWPLCIDPQGQANKWVKALERPHNLAVIKLSEGGEYMRTLENAVQFGLPVLLENVGEELDPSLEPLLLKQIFKQGGANCIRLGDATVEYSSDFRFYITTKLRNPHYLPEVAVKVTLLNFMITPAGLSDQMLGVVVATERPDLEEQKAQLVVQSAVAGRKLKEIEDKILEVLSASSGNILEDESAINIITQAKTLGNEIAEKQAVAEATEQEIDVTRAGYKTCGDYTSILFFCISDLAVIDPMYQYSLPWFINLFVASVHAAPKDDKLSQRLENVHDHFTYALYCNVCRSLFEKDKLLFAFLLCARILESKGAIDPDEWLFLLTGGLGATPARANPAPQWLVDRSWKEVLRLSQLPTFLGLDASLETETGAWKMLYDASEPHKVVMPGVFACMDTFRKLLILRCLRPDKVVPLVQEFVAANIGQKYVEPPSFDLHACYADSSATTPLIFVLSPGSDPTAALLQFAGERGMSSRMVAVSLGQGQGPKAAALIEEGAQSGTWVVLQNCHLAPSWMPSLDKLCEELNPDTTHAEFRLWMTSYPSPKFPVNILQNGVKMTNEPPKGVRANMRRSYLIEPVSSDEFFEGCNKPAAFKRLAFGLIFFHALVQERRRFGPLGWNIAYGFDDGDQRISMRQLHMYLSDNDKVPFDALRYLTGECNYGGRVTDDKDRLLLNTLLGTVYCPSIVEDESYKLSASGLYYAPPDGDRASYIQYIDKLPIIPLPEAFGLHENADITKDQNDTAAMFASLLSMGGGGGGGSGAAVGTGAEERVAAIVEGCLQRLPANFDIEAVQEKYPVRYEESLNTVLAQEMSRFNRLLAVMRDSLQAMSLALQGLQVMSGELEAAYKSISINMVPELWHKASYPSLKPLGSYLEDLYRRLQMLADWYQNGPPAVFWLPGFFFVQSFLTAGLQNYARQHRIPIDMVGYDFEMLGMDAAVHQEPPKEGLYTHGLFLEGCGWDSHSKQLCESQPKVLFVSAPCIWLRPKRTEQFAVFNHYNCPMYRTLERRGVLATTGHSTNFVMFVKMPSHQPASHWTLRGVALITSLSD